MKKKYIEVKHFQAISMEEQKKKWLSDNKTFVPYYTLIGKYIQSPDQILNAIDGEFDNIEGMEPGTIIQLTIIEMKEEEFKKLPEFTGY